MDPRTQTALFLLGRPFSPIYGTAMRLRAYLYQKNICRTRRIPMPVISVGNLTMGGTGKTPLVIYLASFLKNQGYSPAVVSRGYHGKASAPVNIVSDGHCTFMSAAEAGDEPVLMADRLAGTVVATGKKRYAASLEVARSYGCNLIVLDDGFQHLGMARDIDLVLFDVEHFAGNSRVFPGGELREPISALKRCNGFVVTGVDENNAERAANCESLLRRKFADKPVFLTSRIYRLFYRYGTSSGVVERSVIDPAEIPRNLFAFSGIARPERFYQMLDRSGIDICGRKVFRDHHSYSAADIETLAEKAQEAGAAGFITTEKDMVKLKTPGLCPLPVYVPHLEIARNDALESFIINNLKDISCS